MTLDCFIAALLAMTKHLDNRAPALIHAGAGIAVTVTLKPDGAGTLLTLSHEKFFDQAAADGHCNGWTGSLDRPEKFVA